MNEMKEMQWITMVEAKVLLKYKSRTSVYKFVALNNIGVSKQRYCKRYFSQNDIIDALDRNRRHFGQAA